VVDLPPGTGDILLALLQNHPIAGAIVVTTPQKVSLYDVVSVSTHAYRLSMYFCVHRCDFHSLSYSLVSQVKGIDMLHMMHVPLLSIVQNMSYFTCTGCDKKHFIFGEGFLDDLCERFGVDRTAGFDVPLAQGACVCECVCKYVSVCVSV
jgi:ATP-binding protein involved in chromosome partitioning